ncbi:hypothetical protein [Anaeroselena agilis]|uniref:DNA (cytosine-5-)-methyltransferase n=1 Tax=Anaeroselena agilis TaxID=3063788 RepID=A0ABU3NTA7_9FIRM|nr:hypothetical protein [Selenomonadales bacterium 4137-cl]
MNREGSGGDDLATAVARQLWPTPRGFDANAVALLPCQNKDRKRSSPTHDGLARTVAMWPTPRANDAEKRGDFANDPRNGLPAVAKYWPMSAAQDTKNSTLLASQIGSDTVPGALLEQLWPTPRAGKTAGEDAETWLKRKEAGKVSTPPLELAVKMWPTPVAQDSTGSTGGFQHSSLRTEVLGQLNADWVECLMGFPIGWTDVECKTPRPWPGWPAPLGAGNWPTPQCFDATCGDLHGKEYTGANRHALKLGNCINSETGQYDYEPPRTTTGQKNRAKRLKCCGNSVVWLQVLPIMQAIMEVEYDFLYA